MAGRQFLGRLAPALINGARSHHCLKLSQISCSSALHPRVSLFSSVSQKRWMSASQKFDCINIQDDSDFEKKVIESKLPVIVDFHAEWCGPCKLLGPRLEAIVSRKEGKVILAKVNIDDNQDLAMNFGVSAVPTVVAVKGGKVQESFVGLQEDDLIDSFVERLIN